MGIGGPRSRVVAAVAAVMIGAASLAACGGTDDSANSSDTTVQAPGEVAGGSATTLPSDARSVIYTADLSVRADDIPAATDRAVAIVSEQGGVLADLATGGGERPFATVVARVPPERLAATLDAFAGLGDVESRRQQAQDVTAAVVDVDSRVETLEASVERLRGFLADATSVADVAAIESELTVREQELESLKAQQRELAGQVALATVTLDLQEADATDVVEGIPGVGESLRAGLDALWAVARVSLVVVAFLLPFLVIAALVTLVVVLWVRRRRRRRPAAAVPPAQALPGSPPPPPPPGA